MPPDYDEEIRLKNLLRMPNTDAVRSVIYSVCHKFPAQDTQSFLKRLDSAFNPEGNRARSLAMTEIWQQSVDHAVLKDDALDLLDSIRTKGFKLALVSNTPPISHGIIDRLKLRNRFDHIVFSCDVGYLKPDPRIFIKALQGLNVRADETIIVGDKIRTDILGGAILGMRAVLLETRLRASVDNDQNYVNAIICRLSDFFETRIWKECCEQQPNCA